MSGRYVVMGVSGAGKSVIGAAFAESLGVEFVEGDGFHPARNNEGAQAMIEKSGSAR